MTVMPKTNYDRGNPLYHRCPEGPGEGSPSADRARYKLPARTKRTEAPPDNDKKVVRKCKFLQKGIFKSKEI